MSLTKMKRHAQGNAVIKMQAKHEYSKETKMIVQGREGTDNARARYLVEAFDAMCREHFTGGS